MATKQLRKSITQFSQFFGLAGLDEKNFIVPEDGTWAAKAAMLFKRMKVAQMVLNGGDTINKANTSQWKHSPWFEIIPDETALAGFRLSCDVYVCDPVFTSLGARPEFEEEDDAVWFGETFLEECQLLAQYQVMAERELMAELSINYNCGK